MNPHVPIPARVPHPARTVKLRVRRWGDAYALVIPPPVAGDLRLQEGAIVEVRLRKHRAHAPPPSSPPAPMRA